MLFLVRKEFRDFKIDDRLIWCHLFHRINLLNATLPNRMNLGKACLISLGLPEYGYFLGLIFYLTKVNFIKF